MTQPQSAQSPDTGRPGPRVAVVGSGPAGFYAALDLLAHPGLGARVDMFDRLPAPMGLVRYGVAPDHQKIKAVAQVFERGADAGAERFRFFGNVALGRDISLEELRARYEAVVLAFGAETDRRLGIPGEDLPGVVAAREFVAWYNSHPDYADARFNLSGERAVVVGIGNVAIDVARILVRTPAELAATDISVSAEEALRASRIRDITVLARRGPLQAACTPVELRELAHLQAADLVVAADDLALDPASAAQLAAGTVERQSARNLAVLKDEALRAPRANRKVIRLRFGVSPVEILGRERVEGVRIRRNRLVVGPGGRLVSEATEATEDLVCDAVFRSIGYRVAPIEGVPYDAALGAIPHDAGQVLTSTGGAPEPGLFVTGWAKRGPSGVIGTNKPDAAETVARLIAVHEAGALPAAREVDVADLLASRGVRAVSRIDWQALDALERRLGEAEGRPRRKLATIAAMLAAIDEERVSAP